MYNTETCKKILELKAKGLSSRKIATKLNISKSGINYYLAREQTEAVDNSAPRILLFDLETAADISLHFGRWKQNISQKNVVKSGGYILCAAWKYLGDSKISSISLTPEEIDNGDDSRIIATFFELYEDADAVVAHNSKGFDHKVLQARATANYFPALPVVKVLDTLEIAKKSFRLPSNKLGDVAEYFGLETKLDTSGITLWKEVQFGNKQAMKDMLQYCEQDVVVLEQVYLRIRHAGKAGSDFNAGLYYNDEKLRCRTCGSDDIHLTGRVAATSLSLFEEYRCDSCGAVHRNRTSTTTKGKRKNLVM
jgi:DNA polymerase III epsilon subunit-like protein